MTRESALALVARLQFRPFSKADWMSFSGCNTDNPLIAETDELLVILDGNELEIFPFAADPLNPDESHKFSLQFM